jgi:hypothetical protein
MKSLEFIFQETKIHFLMDYEGHVMVNATEMAQAFGKRTDVFLKTEHVKAFISAAIRPPYGGRIKVNSIEDLVKNRGRNGVFFHRALALKFAAWLDPEFEVWVFTEIDELLFGNYKKHWEAHAAQEKARIEMEELKRKMLSDPDVDTVRSYFEHENMFKNAKSAKTNAIKNQLRLFE